MITIRLEHLQRLENENARLDKACIAANVAIDLLSKENDQLRTRVEELEAQNEALLECREIAEVFGSGVVIDTVEAVKHKARAQEREACALVCDAYRNEYEHGVGTAAKAIWMTTRDCAQGIRARGNDDITE